jgi:hypothetical protein
MGENKSDLDKEAPLASDAAAPPEVAVLKGRAFLTFLEHARAGVRTSLGGKRL